MMLDVVVPNFSFSFNLNTPLNGVPGLGLQFQSKIAHEEEDALQRVSSEPTQIFPGSTCKGQTLPSLA